MHSYASPPTASQSLPVPVPRDAEFSNPECHAPLRLRTSRPNFTELSPNASLRTLVPLLVKTGYPENFSIGVRARPAVSHQHPRNRAKFPAKSASGKSWLCSRRCQSVAQSRIIVVAAPGSAGFKPKRIAETKRTIRSCPTNLQVRTAALAMLCLPSELRSISGSKRDIAGPSKISRRSWISLRPFTSRL